jgi:hypothetical protein
MDRAMGSKPGRSLTLLKFLHEHAEKEIRQGVLHRTQGGIAFLTLQKKAFKKASVCNSAQRSGKNIARVVAHG